MSSAKQNQHIGRLIVGAMSIDGSLDKSERKKVASTLEELGMGELIADVGSAIEEDHGNINMFEECKALMHSLGSEAKAISPLIFRIIADVVASDRFVSAAEANYLAAMAKRLEISIEEARAIFKQVIADRRGRIEVAPSSVDAALHPHLKELLSFNGAESLVGQLVKDSVEEKIQEAQTAGSDVSLEDVERAMTVLGLSTNATLEDAEEVWRETIDNLNLPKMASLGETFVSAAINRITRINEAYKAILRFHESL